MANTYLSRTPSTAGNRKTWTFSAWIKTCVPSQNSVLISCNNGYSTGNASGAFGLRSSGSHFLTYAMNGITTASGYYGLSMACRDTSAWYHVVHAMDTTQATASDRQKIYVNGILQTDLAFANYPTLNYEPAFNDGTTFMVGGEASGSYFNGSMAHVHFIDGIALSASPFGETDATTGIWKPKTAPSVTYGTNGFFLKFENSASLGLDSSPNTNNFTVNGTPTQTVDTPANVFCTMNPLSALTTPPTFSNGNLTTAIPNSGGAFRSTLAVSTGKWYCEVKLNEMVSSIIGIQPIDTTYSTNIFNDSAGIGLYSTTGRVYKNTVSLGDIASVASGDIIGMAIDLDNNNIYFSKNGQYASGIAGSWNQAFGSAYAVATTSGNEYCIAGANGASQSTGNFSFNFGNGYFGTTAVASATTDESGLGTFEYTVPAGYYSLCTKNINTQEYS